MKNEQYEPIDVVMLLDQQQIDAHFQAIRDHIRGIEAENRELRCRLDTFNKDDELQAKEDQIHELYRNSLLMMSDREREAQQKFTHNHYVSCHNSGCYHYMLSGTGIGTKVVIRCPVCGNEEDITDYGSW